MIGTQFAVSAFINPVLWRFERGAQLKAIHMFAAQLGFVMPFWYGMGLVLLLAETFCDAASAGARAARDGKRNLGTGDRADSDVVVPINNKFARAEMPQMTVPAERDHRKWDRMHRLRSRRSRQQW